MIVIDPARHPDLAATQFVLSLSQLQILVEAAGPDALRRRLRQKGPDGLLAAEVLELIASRQVTSLKRP
jgi:hypothetical protein